MKLAGVRSLARADLRQMARPQLAALAEETGDTCHLTTLQGNSVLFVEGAQGTTQDAVKLREGLVLPAHATAAGKAILAAMRESDVRALFPRGAQSLTGSTLQTMADIEEHLHSVARKGYATNFNESLQDFSALAVVVRGVRGQAIGALTLGTLPEHLPKARIPLVVRRMHRASLSITDAIVQSEAISASVIGD
ncbi:MAG: IclR family transcriptional regulator [Ancrocorticia sp.]|uniref:IclR family transcriptional regulator n=1 Tax=Ancrocorticia sp. TaxID=2593684 RepID=UPI003F92472B